MRKIIGLLSLALVMFAATPIVYTMAQDDDNPAPQERHRADGKSCDNSIERAPDDRCACEHAEKCDPNDPDDKARHEKMSDKCQWYCHENFCKCGNECNS